MKLTCLFNKIAARDPTVFPAWEVLRMATIEGARAVGLGDEMRAGEVLIADEAAVREEAQIQAEQVARRVAADPVHKEIVLLEAMKAGQL